MPEMHFWIEWPDGDRERCYSPSYVIEEHLTAGESYATPDFLARARAALETASERVRARYGFECTSAIDQLAALEARAASVAPAHRDGQVKVLAFDKHPPRDARAEARKDRAAAGVSEAVSVVVVGAGQAGLSVSNCLKEAGIDHVVLEKARVGNSWRTQRWDSFCLVTPNWQCQLPGHPYAGPDPDGFMKNEEIVAYLDSYVRSFQPPVREGVEVVSLDKTDDGYLVTTSAGTFAARQVVVATGGYHVPRIPDAAGGLPADVVQLHSAEYRNPQSLPPGDVLVVGTGQSGCQIAEDLFLAGRRVHLSVGPAPRCARRYRGRDVVEWLHRMGHYDLPVDQHPLKEAAREKTNHYVTGRDGGHDIDLRRFALEGMRLYGPLTGATDGRITFAEGLRRHLDDADDVYRSINRSIDAYIAREGVVAPTEPVYSPPWEPDAETLSLDVRAANIRSVVWSVGFGTDFSWIKLPVLDARGYPLHARGITPLKGLYVIGLSWLHTWGSGRFCGVGRDARHIVQRVALVAGAASPAHWAPGAGPDEARVHVPSP